MLEKRVSGYFNQTVALDFTVQGSLDGTTFHPAPFRAPRRNGDPQNLYRFVVDKLGVIDVDYNIPEQGRVRLGTVGYRYVTSLWIDGPVAADADARIELVDATSGTIHTQKVLKTFGGAGPDPILFERCGFYVPQGSSLRVLGVAGSAATPVRLRLHFDSLDTVAQIIQAQRVATGL